MKISKFDLIKDEESVKATALVTFEDCDQPEKEVFIKTSNACAKYFNLISLTKLIFVLPRAARYASISFIS